MAFGEEGDMLTEIGGGVLEHPDIAINARVIEPKQQGQRNITLHHFVGRKYLNVFLTGTYLNPACRIGVITRT